MKRKNSTCSRMSSSRYSFHHLLSKLIFPHNNLFHVLVVVLSFPTTTSLHIISSTTTQSLPLWGGRSIRLSHRCSSSDDSGKCYYNYNSINPSIPSTSFIQTHLSSNLNNNDMEGDNNIGLQQPSLLALAFPPIPPSLPTLDGDADRALKYGIELEDIGKCRAASAAFHEAATLYQCFLDSYSEENEAEEDQEVGWMMREEDSLLPSHAFSHVTGLRAPSFSSSSLLLSEEEENMNGNNGDNTNTLDNTNHLTTTTTITTGISNSNDSSSSINNDDNDTPASALAFACVRLADIYHDALGDSRAANRLYRDVAKIMDAMTRKRVKCMEMESKIMMLNNRKLKTNREGKSDDNNDDEGNEMLVGDGENKIILPPLPSPPSRGVHDGIGITLEGSGGRLEDAVEAYRRALSPFGRPIIDSNNELKQHDSSFTKDENNNNDQDNESIGYDDDQLGYVDNELDYLGTDHYYNRYDHHRDHHRSNNQWWLDYDEREEHHRPAAISFRLAD